MKVLYDYQGFMQHHGGVSRYHIELIKNLRNLGVECDVPFLLSGNVYLDEVNICHANPFSFMKSKLQLKGMKWVNQKIDLHFLNSGKFDVFHPTFLNPYYIGHTKDKPVVQTMHDFIHEKTDRADSAVVRKRRKKVLEQANAIICISNETKNDLLEFYNVPENKVKVIYHGTNQDIISCTSKPIFDFPYLLYIGNRNGYKNFNRFINAFVKITKDIHLVCTGIPFNSEELQTLFQLGISERVHQKFVSEEEMKNLLCNAVAFIYPSMMEGFGLPILEAFRTQCPCIISDIPCFREVADNGAIYFEPHSVDDIYDKINKTIQNAGILQNLKQKGVERLKLFTWEKTARETLELYESVL